MKNVTLSARLRAFCSIRFSFFDFRYDAARGPAASRMARVSRSSRPGPLRPAVNFRSSGARRRTSSGRPAIRGRGWSSPVVSNGRVWMTTSVARRRRRVASRAGPRCRERPRARRTWKCSGCRTPHLKNPKNSHASPTPIVEGDRVYVHFGGDGTAAFDATSGAIVWAKKFPYASQHGSGGSPTLHGDLLIFSGDGHYEAWVIALDKRTGDVKWKTERRKPFDQAYTTPLVISVNGRDQVVSVGAYRAAAYDVETGKEIWMVRYEDGFSNVPRPVFAHGLVYITTGFFQPAMLAVRADGTWGCHNHAHRMVDDPRRAIHAVARSPSVTSSTSSAISASCRASTRKPESFTGSSASAATTRRRRLRRRPNLFPERRRGRDGHRARHHVPQARRQRARRRDTRVDGRCEWLHLHSQPHAPVPDCTKVASALRQVPLHGPRSYQSRSHEQVSVTVGSPEKQRVGSNGLCHGADDQAWSSAEVAAAVVFELMPSGCDLSTDTRSCKRD